MGRDKGKNAFYIHADESWASVKWMNDLIGCTRFLETIFRLQTILGKENLLKDPYLGWLA